MAQVGTGTLAGIAVTAARTSTFIAQVYHVEDLAARHEILRHWKNESGIAVCALTSTTKRYLPSLMPLRSADARELVDQFRHRRYHLGLRGAELDDRLGYADRLPAKWEAYTKAPGIEGLVDWARALGCKLMLVPLGQPAATTIAVVTVDSRQRAFHFVWERPRPTPARPKVRWQPLPSWYGDGVMASAARGLVT